MGTYKFRQHFINGFGQKVVKGKMIRGELGTGVTDVNGKEIFEGDIVDDGKGNRARVVCRNGGLVVRRGDDDAFAEDTPIAFSHNSYRIVGHVDD